MSKYTTQLRWIVEQIGQGLKVPDGQEYADAVYKYIGLSKYPIFDEAYRSHLNDKIIDHYFFREIGQETAAQFSQMMKRTMQEIMPKYNRLYNIINTEMEHPLSDYVRHRDINEDYTSEVDGTTSSQSNGTSSANTTDHNRNVFQDTPMSLLSNNGSPSIENLDYATNVTYNDGNGTTSGTTSTTNNGTSSTDRTDNRAKTEEVYGRNQTLAGVLDEFVDKFVDVDVLVIKDLEDLFFKLW